ncbi:hypothetical protein PGT21_021631 [Puccinia graminis f. sp. tritici]|uniref:HAT C-terminal dimerisation domain-containing protein n=1 Tax=Puccinia graminis f. sp. tritici TaxID=56615 RepID=A0A5B0QJ97_PUCGR|nr:hypothetical protein PGT21_021631 [Puccinia graminis f. sp. tritici]
MDLFPEAIEASVPNQLAIYLWGKYKSLPGQAGQCLKWWKEHHKEAPVLASLAKDYLACSATSASVERCFSAAADVCGPDQGRLSIRNIERSVSSNQWLKQGLKSNDEFQTAQDVVSHDLMEKEVC